MKKVYIVKCESDFDFRGAEQIGDLKSIKRKAKELNTVYSLEDFQEECNNEMINLSNSFILID